MDVRVQLKVCEGCGCLWYRSQNHRGVYCAGCDAKLKQFPEAGSRRRPGPKPGVTLLRIWAVAEDRTTEDLFGDPIRQGRRAGGRLADAGAGGVE
jgi:hypothetical protein